MLLATSRTFGLALAAAVVVAACGGATSQPSQPSAAATAAAPKGPRLGSFDRPIVMAFVPSQDTARITASGKAIAASLEKSTALKWDVKVPTSYAATIEGMCSGQIDVAWLAPLSFVLASQKNCADVLLGTLRVNPLTRQLSTTYDSQILVRADSGINDIKGLKGKKFAFADPLSTSGFLFPTVLIKQQTGEDPKSFFSSFTNTSHDAAVTALYQGQVDGAASFIDVRDTLEKTFPDIKQKTKRIATSGPIPNDTVSVRKDFPADLRDKIQQALLDYSKTDDGKKALKALYSIDGLDKTDAKNFQPVADAAKIIGIDLEKEAAATARPVATPAPSPTKAP